MTQHPIHFALSLFALAMTTSAHAEGAFAQLYAARPPAGSSFVRVLNPGTEPLRVKIANGPEQTLSGNTIASSYAIVKGQTDFTVTPPFLQVWYRSFSAAAEPEKTKSPARETRARMVKRLFIVGSSSIGLPCAASWVSCPCPICRREGGVGFADL